MAKIAFSKLKCKLNEDSIPLQIGEETIAVKQYLPIQEKLELIGRVVEYAHDENYNFANPVKIDVLTKLQIIFNYTNISFTEKQKEDLPKLYDLLYSSGIIDTIIKAIPEEEYYNIVYGVRETIECVYKYQNSVLGLLTTITQDYEKLNIDLSAIQEKVTDPETLKTLKDVMEKLG